MSLLVALSLLCFLWLTPFVHSAIQVTDARQLGQPLLPNETYSEQSIKINKFSLSFLWFSLISMYSTLKSN